MKRSLVWLFVLVGCDGAHRIHGDDDAVDAGVDDPITCGSLTCDQTPPASCVDGDTLREHTAACTHNACSYPATDTECGAAGCCGDHCCGVAPSNAEVTGTLMPTGFVIAPPNGRFDTDTACTATSALGHCEVVARPGLPEACVCRMDELVIDNLEISGSRALVILASKSVRVTTGLDVSGDQEIPGPGAMPAAYTTQAGSLGGVGGSFATAGGGASGNLTLPAATYGTTTLIPLHGGTSGQAGGYGGGGGGGGGAVQITAGERIEITGKVLAGGGGGPRGVVAWATAGGSGGGSGGAILLEAPTVVMTGTLNANGGGGGGGDGSHALGDDGEDANDEVASGGQGGDGAGCTLHGYIYGGDGGSGATSTSPAGVGEGGRNGNGCLNDPYIGGGGGGGGLGRIRINTLGGCQCNGTVSPDASFGALVVQ